MHSKLQRQKGFSSIAVLLGLFVMTWFLVLPRQSATAQPDASLATTDTWYGLYTDGTSYEPGQTIQVYGSAPDQDIIFRLVRMDTAWTEITRTQPISVGPQISRVGSFIEFPSVTLSGRDEFTLEGWLHPTLLGSSVITDTVVVAGQIGLAESAAGIVILSDGRLAAYVSDTPATNLANLAIAPAPADFEAWLDEWHHLALTYDSAQVKLYVDGVLAAQRAQTGNVATVAAPFRVGARAEAPGDLTGVLDGRIDNWALWPAALSETQVETRRQRGLVEADPAPDPAIVDLYLNFEDTYPDVIDGSNNGHVGTVFNHGNPGVAGVITDTGRAFRLNHDQIVDAGWGVTAQLTVPQGAQSGMYAVQALVGPDFTPTQSGNRLSVRALAIRPPAAGPHAPIAVVLPTNTWNAYTSWPGTATFLWPGDQGVYGPSSVTQRRRYPGSHLIASAGNNSAYGKMGDGASLAYFHGWQRPSYEASPIISDTVTGDYNVRAPNSKYMVQWLDMMGFAYDVYSDDDFDQGRILAANHRVLMPHSHHEYWSDGMLASLTQFLDDGGSVVAPAGNIFTWRIIYGENRVLEVRKWRQAPIVGIADVQSGIDGTFMGGLLGTAICNGTNDTYYGFSPHKALGVATHATKPCSDRPFCYGQWAAHNTDHWLWQGSGLVNDDLFGLGRLTDSFALGHEMDTWDDGMPLPGLAPGQDPVILGEGQALRPDNSNAGDLPRGRQYPDGHPLDPNPTPTTCEGIITAPDVPAVDLEQAGTILYFPHAAGGHVLVIGATATPWALASDSVLTGLLQRSLACFAYDQGCGYGHFLPLVTRGS